MIFTNVPFILGLFILMIDVCNAYYEYKCLNVVVSITKYLV